MNTLARHIRAEDVEAAVVRDHSEIPSEEFPRRPILKSTDAVDEEEATERQATSADPIQRNIDIHRRGIAGHEQKIAEAQRAQAVTEADLQHQLAILAQDTAARIAAIERTAAEQEAMINAQIEENRTSGAARIKVLSRLVAASHACLSELERDIRPVDEGARRQTIVHRHTNINSR